MKWEKFEESKTELPEVLVGNLIEGFSNATNDLVQLVTLPKTEMQKLTSNKLNTTFQFSLRLQSSKLSDYSLKLLEFGYNASLYPVKVYLAPGILEDLRAGGESLPQVSSIDNEEAFKKLLELVFSGNKFKQTVGGLMKIVRKNDDPF